MDKSEAQSFNTEKDSGIPFKKKPNNHKEDEKSREARRAVRLERLNAHKALAKATNDEHKSKEINGARAKTSIGIRSKQNSLDNVDTARTSPVQQIDKVRELREARLKRLGTVKSQQKTTDGGQISIEKNVARAKTSVQDGRKAFLLDVTENGAVGGDGKDGKQNDKKPIAPLQHVRQGRSPSERNWRDRRKGNHAESKAKLDVDKGQTEKLHSEMSKETDKIPRQDRGFGRGNGRPGRGQNNPNQGKRNMTPGRDKAIGDLNWRNSARENKTDGVDPIDAGRRDDDTGAKPEHVEDVNDHRERNLGNEHRGRGHNRGHGGGRNPRQGRGRDGGHGQRLNTQTLKDLQEEEPSVIALTLANSGNGFKDALASAPVSLLLRVIAKAFTCNSTSEALNRIFMDIKEKEFLASTIGYFMAMVTEQSERRRQTFVEPIKDIITIMEQLSGKHPNCITELLALDVNDDVNDDAITFLMAM